MRCGGSIQIMNFFFFLNIEFWPVVLSHFRAQQPEKEVGGVM